jgi:hypothetical protein
MSSTSTPRIQVYKADAAIAKGKAVKIGSDREHVAVCSANTDKAIGILQSASTAAEDLVEVALQGGGAKALIGETISAGAYLVAHTDGTLVKPNAAGDHVCAMAMEDAVANDLAAVEVVMLEAQGSE